ncbi:LOW QUALITY PROTEIN: V-set and immunoglobulin domain-containing protein 10-like 2 [Anas acuta]|uniref:LOW QUALITY PROTEIN: V-set and immunoglobulin domain-containing protein 10-like 2 n=1 Tax=Anas acuta TaxID=28680 RepID=UPI0035C8B3B6
MAGGDKGPGQGNPRGGRGGEHSPPWGAQGQAWGAPGCSACCRRWWQVGGRGSPGGRAGGAAETWPTRCASRPAQPLDAGSVSYEERTVTGVRGQAVELSCGPAVPAVVFWSFTAAGSTGPPQAVAVGSGLEAMVAPGVGALGQASLLNGTLELRELRTAAAGRFFCQGLFPEPGRLRVGYAAVLLRVLVPVSRPFVRLTAAAAVEGTEVTLMCAVREGTAPLSFSWQHREPRGGALAAPMGLGGSGAELRLAPANRSHAGWYVCTARNEVNNRSSEPVYLDIIYGPDEPAISMEPFSPEQGGFSAGEREDVVLSCLAPSNPPSRYIWLHNGSQVHTGQTFVIAAIARGQAGTYTCLAENTHLQTRTQATIILTVYCKYLQGQPWTNVEKRQCPERTWVRGASWGDKSGGRTLAMMSPPPCADPPAGSPSCSALATADLRDVALRCRWPGGFPPAQLRWVGPGEEEEEEEEEEVAGPSFSMATNIRPGVTTRNGSSFACLATHPTLREGAMCRTTLWVPAGSPACTAVASKHDEFVMLRCRWEGGMPPATLRWWDSRGEALGVPMPSAAVLVLSADASLGGQDFICVATHPLRVAAAQCHLRLGKGMSPRAVPSGAAARHAGSLHSPSVSVPSRCADIPKLEVERSEVAVLEGGEARLACRWCGVTQLGAEMVWYDPQEREVPPGMAKYWLEQDEAWANLTVRDAEWPGDGGTYRCTAANAVGTTSLPVHLRVDRYPAPPNVTISKLRYTRARTEVRLEWRTQGTGNLTGFVVQRRQAKKPQRRAPGPWETAAGDIEPHSRDRRLGGLDPTVVYAFRVLAVNHRTAGHPSEVQTPAEPPFEALPAVTGAAVVGMLVATAVSLLAVRCVARHRDNLPRLHNLLFHTASPEAPEIPSTTEDAPGATNREDRAEQGQGDAGGPSTTASSEPLSALPDAAAADLPVDVPIVVMATP